MKKLMKLSALALMVFLTACQSIAINPEKNCTRKLEGFLESVKAKDIKKAETFLTAEAKKTTKIQVHNNSYIDEYALSSQLAQEGAVYYEFMLSQVNSKRPYHRIIDSVAIFKKNTSLKIDHVKELRYVEVYPEQDKILFSAKNMEQPITLFSLKEVPNEYVPTEAGDGNPFKVGKEGFGEVRLSFDKKKLAFATYGENGMIGLYDFVHKTITPVNLFIQGRLKNIYWAQNSEDMAYTVTTPVGSSFVQLFNLTDENIREIKLATEITYPEYSVSLNGWIDNDTIELNITDEGVGEKIDQNLLGKWVYDIGRKKMKKIKG